MKSIQCLVCCEGVSNISVVNQLCNCDIDMYNTRYMYCVSTRKNDKGGGVYQWYMKFGRQCSISVVKQWGSEVKVEEWYHPMREGLNK